MSEPNDYVAKFERNRKIAIGVIVGVLVLGVLFVFSQCGRCAFNVASDVQESNERRAARSQKATPEQIASVNSAVVEFEAGLPAKSAAWQTGMAKASQLVPRPDLGRCPIKLPLRQPYDASRGSSFNNLDSFSAIVFPGRQGFPHDIVRGGALPSVPPRVEAVQKRAARLRERIRRQGRLEDFTKIVASARALNQGWTYDVVVFASTYRRPFASPGGQSFTPGRLDGIAVLYDYASNTVACAGEVHAESTSHSIEYTAQMLHESTALQGRLTAEFESVVERAIAKGLRWRAGARQGDAAAAADGGTAIAPDATAN